MYMIIFNTVGMNLYHDAFIFCKGEECCLLCIVSHFPDMLLIVLYFSGYTPPSYLVVQPWS
jgi:hypothetical protein